MSPLLELGSVAATLFVAGWVSRRIGLSPIVGYLVFGMVLGPHGPVPLLPLGPTTTLLGELGLVLLLFYMGLEFSLARFLENARPALRAGLADLALLPVGVAVGLALGFGWLASGFLGGIVYVSSSGVIAKLLAESDLIAYPEAERTLSVLVFEDLAMVVVLGGLGLATAGGAWWTFLGAAAFLALFGLAARFGRGVLARLLAREGEALALLALALVALVASGALRMGFPEAVAAFLLGMVAAESGHAERVEHALRGWYDVAAAAFFLVVGLHVELGRALGHAPLALLLVAVTISANLASAFAGGRASGLSRRASVGHGLMLLPRGEFSLVLASLAAEASALPAGVGDALLGATSLYVAVMVALGSVVFDRFERIDAWIARRLETPTERARRLERQASLDAIDLE